jgi:hypothetical protein
MEVNMRKLSVGILLILLIALIAIASCTTGSSITNSSSTAAAAKIGAPAKLAFVTQPGGAAAGSLLSSQPVLAIQDAKGNTVTGSILPVKLSVTGGGDNNSVALFGPTTMNAVNGVAKFNNLMIDRVGSGFVMTASCGNLTSAISNPFAISPGPPAKLVFTVQPSGCVAGTPFTTQPEVTVQDNFGNKVTNYDGSVTIVVSYGSGITSAKLLGTATVQVENSVAKFRDLSIDKSFPDYKLTAVSGSLASEATISVTVTASTPAILEFTVQPADAKAGKPFETQPKVAIEDKYGNVVNSARGPITVELKAGTGSTGAVLSGNKTLPAQDALGGLVEFNDLAIDKAGSGYILKATSGSLTPTESQTINVNQ